MLTLKDQGGSSSAHNWACVCDFAQAEKLVTWGLNEAGDKVSGLGDLSSIQEGRIHTDKQQKYPSFGSGKTPLPSHGYSP